MSLRKLQDKIEQSVARQVAEHITSPQFVARLAEMGCCTAARHPAGRADRASGEPHMTIRERFKHFTEPELLRKMDRNAEMIKHLESETRELRKLIRAKQAAAPALAAQAKAS